MVLNHFPGAKDLVEQVQDVFSYWDEVVLMQERHELNALLKMHKVHTLYTDIDTGKVPYTWSLIVKEMNVYEEGTQNYRSIRADYIKYPITTKIREIITPILGWGAHLGSNRKTKNIFLYNPEYFQTNITGLKSKVKPLQQRLYQFLKENLSRLNVLFPIPSELAGVKSERIAIYITSHDLNEEIIQKLKDDAGLYDRILIKIHPHILYERPGFVNEIAHLPFELIKENFLAEMLFMTLLKNENTIFIFHESSTACLYLEESDQVKIYDYRENNYREFYKALRQCYLNSANA